jgi:hypothetical protein
MALAFILVQHAANALRQPRFNLRQPFGDVFIHRAFGKAKLRGGFPNRVACLDDVPLAV